jgi:hypothetical protein
MAVTNTSDPVDFVRRLNVPCAVLRLITAASFLCCHDHDSEDMDRSHGARRDLLWCDQEAFKVCFESSRTNRRIRRYREEPSDVVDS